jgi:hypothetical protein
MAIAVFSAGAHAAEPNEITVLGSTAKTRANGVNFREVVQRIGHQDVAQIRHGGVRASFLTILKGITYWLRYPDPYGTGGGRS